MKQKLEPLIGSIVCAVSVSITIVRVDCDRKQHPIHLVKVIGNLKITGDKSYGMARYERTINKNNRFVTYTQ